MSSKTRPKNRMFGAAAKAILACAAAAFACVESAVAETAGKSAAQSSLKWYTDFDTAVSKAKKAGKPIFFLGGRDSCSNTMSTKNITCESYQVSSALGGGYILWFGNVDDDYNTYQYMNGLGTFTLPLTCVINPYTTDDYVVRTTGYLGVSDVLSLLDKASGKVFKTVTFNGNGGTASASSRKVLKGGKVGTLPNATRKGYTLNGWFTSKSGGAEISTSRKVSKNVTYYAHWEANAYRIKFNANGGTGSMGTVSATYGKNVTLPANAFKRSKYSFKGWATKKGGSVVYKNKAKVKNLTDKAGKTVTLYAVWKKKSAKAAAVAGNVGKAAKAKLSFTAATKKLAKTPVTATAGNPVKLKIEVNSSSSKLTFTAKSLPKGLKINKSTGKITGKPTKPGNFSATVTVKDSKGNKISQKVKFKVSVRSWAKGTFYGYAFPDGGNKPGGYLTFTVGSNGNVSGKVTYKGTAYQFTSKYSYCSAKKAKFTPSKMKLGTKTLDPGVIEVAQNQDRIFGISVIEAVNVNSTYIAQKPVKLVCPGGELEVLNDYEYTFKERDVGSGLGDGDSLKVKVENDVVMVSGWFGGKKIAANSIPLFVTSRKEDGSGYVAYSLCAYIYDHKVKYRKWLFFDMTINDAGDLMDFDPNFR
ncbi:MAG: InlB B-repeat-containing protein [Kiritimatiellae bacterium]|nr:InlB B-repeat-containing protein [Kiritimatiellia bacterium]